MTAAPRRVALGLVAVALAWLAGIPAAGSQEQAGHGADTRPRVIVTTDGEADDQCSMVRYLLYADQFRTRGLIYSSSKHHWAGDGRTAAQKWHGTAWIASQLDAYAAVYPLLKTHANFPAPADLQSQVAVGNIDTEGDMVAESPGSQHIVAELLEPDDSPVWLLAWGGPNTIARALKTIEEQHPDAVTAVSRRARIYLISEQDSTYRDYIAPHWPDLTTLICSASTYGALAYRWENAVPSELHGYFSATWLQKNLLSNHGPLCAMYAPRKDGAFRSEGDSPSFLHLIDTGLRRGERPDWGSWGGRFHQAGNVWRSDADPAPNESPLIPWIAALQNDFAARADWCVQPVAKANHAPNLLVEGPLDRVVAPGERLELRAQALPERDDETFVYRWFQDQTTGSRELVEIEEGDSPGAVNVAIPDAPSAAIHLIVEARDSGAPPLSRWRRVVLRVAR